MLVTTSLNLFKKILFVFPVLTFLVSNITQLSFDVLSSNKEYASLITRTYSILNSIKGCLCVKWLFLLFKLIIEMLFQLFRWKRQWIFFSLGAAFWGEWSIRDILSLFTKLWFRVVSICVWKRILIVGLCAGKRM